MLIFDRFESREKAESFLRTVGKRFAKSGGVYDTQDESNQIDPFLWELSPPVVLVERCDKLRDEKKIAAAVKEFGGHFAGT